MAGGAGRRRPRRRRPSGAGAAIRLLLAAALVPASFGPSPAAGAEAESGRDPVAEVQEPADAGALDSIPGLRLTVHHAPADSLLARDVLGRLEAQPALPALPDTIPSGVRVFLAPDRATFDRLTGGRVPEWSGGVAIPSRSTLVIPTFSGSHTAPGEAARVLRHEWAHIGLYQYLDGARVPRWFSEGYAEWAGGWDAGEAWRLRVALAVAGTPSLDSLSLDWPRDRASANVAYLLAATSLQYLVEASGERGLGIFLERWRTGRSFEDALRATYGLTSGQLEEDWREWVQERYGWLYVLSHSMAMWLFLALVLLVMVRIRARRNRERLDRLRERDPPDRPAWWLEEDGPGADPPDGSPVTRSPPPDVPPRSP